MERVREREEGREGGRGRGRERVRERGGREDIYSTCIYVYVEICINLHISPTHLNRPRPLT